MSVRPDVGLEKLIHGLEQELLEAADEEFMAGARDLGMNPEMKGSAAFLGVKNLTPQLLAALRHAYREHPQSSAKSGADKTTGEEEAEGEPPESGHRGTPKRNVDA
jgi:hypothetical protein